jgi:GH15 family glucan-1,4-alpha-glucosidase
MAVDPRYLPIEDHGAIGNLRTVALIGRDGSIDWCCLPRLDRPATFASILDRDRGGRFRVAPAHGEQLGQQRYEPGTNVLVTTFEGPGGRLVVTDLMPLRGGLEGGPSEAVTEPAILRLLRADGGHVTVDLEWSPRPDLGRAPVRIHPAGDGFVATSRRDDVALGGLAGGDVVSDRSGPSVHARIELEAGEHLALVTRLGADAAPLGLDAAHRWLAETSAAWRTWAGQSERTGTRDWAGEHLDLVVRSELVLKLLCNIDSGAIAAAATTSLPEHVGGPRNWDYRFSWIRDAALAAQALFALGHRTDGHAFMAWAERSARDRGPMPQDLRIVYGLDGDGTLDEEELPDLEGYRRSRPVRVGNAAVDQLQLDIYGELLSAAYEVVRMGDELEDDIRAFLPSVADQACASWQEPDYGIWELRNGPFHVVYSKAMVWMALDRAVRLAGRGVIEGDVERWQASGAAIRAEVLERGFVPELGAFAQSYERPVLDASNLLLPMMELLPVDDPRVQSTIDATIRGLADGDLVFRYRADDGMGTDEGAFALCSFWLVDALALSGRIDEAEERYEAMAGRANHLGLFAEQIDPVDGSFLGNFPQAFTHVGLVNSRLYLAHQQGRALPIPPPIGSDEHRRSR